MEADVQRRASAAGLAVGAAFLWAAYYAFVLTLAPTVPASGLLVWPFAFGGLGYLGWTIASRSTGHLATLSRSPAAWVRVGLLVAMQLSVLAETFLAGAVDTSLLSLVGDVVLTPILVMVALGDGRERARDAVFLGGVGLATAGATLTIVAGGAVRPLTVTAALVGALVPIAVALYFLSAARENRKTPAAPVVTHSVVFAAIVSGILSFLIPGGYGGLVIPSPVDLGLLVALGLTSFFLAPAMYFRAIEAAGIVLPAVLMAAIPVFTFLLAAVLFGQVPPLLGIAGIPLAVVGALLALQGSHPPWSRQYGANARPAESP